MSLISQPNYKTDRPSNQERIEVNQARLFCIKQQRFVNQSRASIPGSRIDLNACKQFRRIFLSRLFRERAAVVMDEVYCRGQRIGLPSVPHKAIAIASGKD